MAVSDGLPHRAYSAGAHLSDLFPLDRYLGRLRYTWALCSPAGLVWGAADVDRANTALAAFAAGDRSRSDAELWHARHVLAACAPHGELLPMPFRPCGWAITGTPIIAFMVWSARRHPTSVRHIFLGQWANQSHIAGGTYFNASSGTGGGGGRDDVVRMATAYAAACLTAIPVAVGAAVASQRVSWLRPFSRFAPFPGVALANAVNCVMVRQQELADGVELLGANGEPSGLYSTSAAAAAVRDTALTRMVIPVGNFLGVPLIMMALEAAVASRARALAVLRGGVPQVAVTACVFALWLPVGIAVFPPIGSIALSDVEPGPREQFLLREGRGGAALVGERALYKRGF